MNNSWPVRFFALSFLCATFPTRAAMISIPKDIMGQGTQYRFQYFVRDESGDYKTQEETGEGGSARGSYAVEEPDGDLRIVQYTANTEGGFKAHIKVDHGGKSPAKFREINIPAAEMRKLVMSNREKVEKVRPEAESSKSYALGPPVSISDVVIEQAAAIREIISKEIEAEEKSEAEEKWKGQENQQPDAVGTTFAAKRNVTRTNMKNEDSRLTGSSSMNVGDIDTKIIDTKPENAESPATNVSSEAVNVQGIDAIGESVKGFEIPRKNEGVVQKMEKIDDLSKNQQSPVVRVIFSPSSTESTDLLPTQRGRMGDEKNVPTSRSSSAKPVRNLSFKNQITFYRPSVNNLGRAEQGVSELDIGKLPDSLDNDEKSSSNNNNEQIVLSFLEKDGEDGYFKSKNVSIPYEVLRPWLK